MRQLLSLAFGLSAIALCAQDVHKAAACFWSNDFELGIPLDWEITQVERQTSAGVGLGEFVPAFVLGDAEDANAGGYFPVPDRPVGNRFIMANDDATPCNCDMDTVSLTTGPIDLSGRTGLALEFRAFHEMTLGAGDAIMEASTNGTDWTLVDTLDPSMGVWQDVFLDLSSYDNAPFFKLRFRWSDGGGWSSGFALDDLCLRERLANDVSVVAVELFDMSASAFNTTDNTLRYTQVPLEQVRPLVVSVVVMNRGLNSVSGIGSDMQVSLDGTPQGSFSTGAVIDLAPGARDTMSIATGWTPTEVGMMEAQATLTLSGTDEDATDNVASATMRITGPGWDDGYGAMAVDDGQVQGLRGSTEGFIAANRFEIVNEGSTARGVSAVIGYDSQIDQDVRAIIMDGNFAFIDTSLRHTITQTDIDGAFGGLPIYLPFVSAPVLAPGDYFVGFQRLNGSGYASVAVSGNCMAGVSAFMTGSTFDITWSEATPMVRLHVNDYGVGADELNVEGTAIGVSPNPSSGQILLTWLQEHAGPTRILVTDASGRTLMTRELGTVPTGRQRLDLDLEHLSDGAYSIQLRALSVTSSARLIIAR